MNSVKESAEFELELELVFKPGLGLRLEAALVSCALVPPTADLPLTGGNTGGNSLGLVIVFGGVNGEFTGLLKNGEPSPEDPEPELLFSARAIVAAFIVPILTSGLGGGRIVGGSGGG